MFEDADDDVVMEEPITELDHMLYQLTGAWESETRNEKGDEMSNKPSGEPGNEVRNEKKDEMSNEPSGEPGNEMRGESTILPILSRVANKLEDMMKVGDTRLREAESLSLDVRAYDDRLQAYQVISVVKFTTCFVSIIWVYIIKIASPFHYHNLLPFLHPSPHPPYLSLSLSFHHNRWWRSCWRLYIEGVSVGGGRGGWDNWWCWCLRVPPCSVPSTPASCTHCYTHFTHTRHKKR